MQSIFIPADASPATIIERLTGAGLIEPVWALAYSDETADLSALNTAIARGLGNVVLVGCSSFQGVFTPGGFSRGWALLVGERGDDVQLASSIERMKGDVASAAIRSCQEIEARLGGVPDMLLMHATPGSEEELLMGVQSVFGTRVPVFGGSAADDNIEGNWRVFRRNAQESDGVVLAGLRSKRRISGGFVGGYLPSDHRGKVTRAEGRVIYELDGRPAAQVYNEWTEGAIDVQLVRGGRILAETNLLPLARSVQHQGAMPRRLLSHPERVLEDCGALACFTRFERGDEVQLMTNTRAGLVPRVRRATERAMEGQQRPRGALLVYCAGCLSSTLDSASEVSREFRSAAGDVPFVGVSTFGEQGTFFTRGNNHHGNLMCSTVVIG